MAPAISSAKVTLSYPLYACAFDPLDSSQLVVGGGGGAGRSGVGNKITLLDVSNPAELEEIAELDLSKAEDNVTSLAVGSKQGAATIVYAGVNCKMEDVAKGNNSHFRVFAIAPAIEGNSATNSVKTREISRSKLFVGNERDLYQRITRLSRPYSGQDQLGAVATGLAKESEIVLFDTSAVSSPKVRGAIQLSKEAVDVDFIRTGADEHLFAYCDEYDVYVQKVSSQTSKSETRQKIYEMPLSRSLEKAIVPVFRSLRWLTKDYLLLLKNDHSQGGVVLEVLEMSQSGEGEAQVAQSYRLPPNIKKATGLALANLTPPETANAAQGYTQFVIAVAGHDISLSLFKVDFQSEAGQSKLSPIKSFRTFRSTHPLQITSLAFSNFTPPARPITASTPAQTLKLASVGVSNTVVVHTLPLFPVPLSVQRGQSKTPRYVVALPSTKASIGGSVLFTLFFIFAVLLTQALLEVTGKIPERLGVKEVLPVGLREILDRGFGGSIKNAAEDSVSKTIESVIKLPELLERAKSGEGEGVVFIKESAGEGDGKVVEAAVHDESLHGPHEGVEWEELSHAQKEGWKNKLKEVGYWVEEMGETVLKGVVFGELGGMVGRAVAGG